MHLYTFKNKSYRVDPNGYLINPKDWDENFAEGMAYEVGLSENLTAEQWNIIHYIRNVYNERQSCPLVYETCKNLSLTINDFKRLFPTGYHRGACKVAGINYSVKYYQYQLEKDIKLTEKQMSKVYRVDVGGFLADPDEWDLAFAICKAEELKMTDHLTDEHWNVIKFLRRYYGNHKTVPTIIEVCDEFNFEIEDLQKMFPDGYHRGALKISGLR